MPKADTPNHSESKIQHDCVKWYRNTFCLSHHNPRCLCFSVPNESNGARVMKLMETGMLPGVADLCVMHCVQDLTSYTGGLIITLFFEFKIPSAITGPRKNGQSQSQIDFQKRCIELGIHYHIVRSLSDFQEVISSL